MKVIISRLAAAWVCAAMVLSMAGCGRYITVKDRFHTVISTDHQGNVISEWTAVGRVKRIEGGVEILAVEKKKPLPYPYEGRYVIGRRVQVLAPNVAVFATAPPHWMRSEMRIIEESVSTGYTK